MTWLWPWSTSSAPAEPRARRKCSAPISRRCHGVERATGGWWMRTTRKRSSRPSASQRLGERLGLGFADPARRHQRRGGHGARHADQRHRLADADERETGRAAVVAGHERRPCLGVVADGAGQVGIVIAGDDGDVPLLAERCKPGAGGVDLRRQPDIDQVAGDRDVVRLRAAEVVDQRDEAGRTERCGTPAPPVGVAEGALRGEVAPADRRQRPEMRIGEMGESEHRARLEESSGGVKPRSLQHAEWQTSTDLI